MVCFRYDIHFEILCLGDAIDIFSFCLERLLKILMLKDVILIWVRWEGSFDSVIECEKYWFYWTFLCFQMWCYGKLDVLFPYYKWGFKVSSRKCWIFRWFWDFVRDLIIFMRSRKWWKARKIKDLPNRLSKWFWEFSWIFEVRCGWNRWGLYDTWHFD